MQTRDVPPRLTSVEGGEVIPRFTYQECECMQEGEVFLSPEEVAGYDGTFEDAIYAKMIPEPVLMPFREWASWRRTKGLRPVQRQGCDRLMEYLEELKLWDRVMRYYHCDFWMITWAASETENVEAYLRSVEGDERVFEQPAPHSRIDEWRGEPAARTTMQAPSAEGAEGVLFYDLKMVNTIQESVQNPFQKWMVDDERESDENQGDSTFIISVHVWISVIWHFLLSVAQYLYLRTGVHYCVT